MSPEQARGEHADYHADQFAIGVMLYEMATGRPPFSGPSVVQTLAAIIETRADRPSRRSVLDFPPAATDIAERCLAKDTPGAFSVHPSARARAAAGARAAVGHASVTAALRPWRYPCGSRHALAVGGARRGGSPSRCCSSPQRTGQDVALAPARRDAARRAAGRRRRRPSREACCPGLQEYVTAVSPSCSGFATRVIVVPAAEVLDSGARTPSAAHRALGANLGVTISVHAAGERQSGHDRRWPTRPPCGSCGEARARFPRELLARAVVALVAPLLDLELGPDEEQRWSGAASPVAEAGALFAQALAQTPYQQGRSALEQIDQQASLERAIDLFNKAVDPDPRYAAAYAGLAEARLLLFRLTKRADDLALAAQASERALALDDSRPAAWTTRGMVRSARGDIAGAEQAFNEAIKRNPAGADTYRELGLAYRRAGQYEKAEAAHVRSMALDPRSWSGHNQLAVFFLGAPAIRGRGAGPAARPRDRARQPAPAVESRRGLPFPAPLA